ncbi:hypothetical protein QYE76_065841 [Lolium multiflorum]|uniref:CCHC-type domain-containing protein n=1 Tax=Lolium multiflorum TaxID=4521 RepID=A0AAD8S9A8_LOLMU|nr:hypothetical protein QYE76_065841 [Lolium multiflorum]
MFAMSGHAKKLSDMGMMIPNQLGIHRVLQSLPPSYKNFVMNYNMQNMNKDLPELFSMLKSAEVEIKKENQVLMVNKTTSFKKQGKPNKGNFKKGGKKVAAHPEKPKAGPKPETVCYYCQGKGHWKRNCSKYLADLKSGHVKKKGISDIHVIDVYLTGSRSSAWVFDTALLGKGLAATMVRMMSEGVVARFLKAATAEMIRNNQKEIRCPCRRCKLTSLMDPKDDMVRDHLLMRGFMDGYRWEGDEDDYEFFHGISTRNKEGGDQDVEDLGHDQDVEDPGDDHDHNVGDPGPDDGEDQDGGHHEDEDDGPSSMDWVQDPYLQELLLKQTSNARAAAREKAKMDQLEVDAVTPLYEGCRPEDTRLKVTLMALEMKVKHKMTDTSFNDNMSFWQERLPKGNDINLYMGLLKEELATLWDTPANTWDAAAEEYFPMRAALLTTVHDFLGYGYVAGQVVHGFNACVRCMDDTTYRQLDRDPGSSKTVFMGHRRWLRDEDPWRKRKDLFDGEDEPRRRPRTRSGEQIDELLKNWKECPPPGKKRKAPEPLLKVWKTRSVFWDLPYWKILRVPHSLDVMHITKNVCESLLGTLLNMPEKTKDGPKARYDLQSIGIREELHAGRPNDDDDDDDDDDDEAEDTQSRRKGKKAKKIEYYCPPRASL